MLIFIETLIVLSVLFYLYKIAFKNESNPFGIPKSLAIAILLVGSFVLPKPIQVFIVVILIIAFIVSTINKHRSKL